MADKATNVLIAVLASILTSVALLAALSPKEKSADAVNYIKHFFCCQKSLD